MSKISRIAIGALALALGATACTDSALDEATGNTPGAVTDIGGDSIELVGALDTVGSCESLLTYLKEIGTERVGPYGFENGPFGRGIMVEESDMADDDAMALDQSAEVDLRAETSVDDSTEASGDFSGTNNQEANVDEADRVKTDGERIVVLAGSELRIIDATAEVPTLASTVELPDEVWGSELFLSGDKALLMGSGWTAFPLNSDLAADSFVENGMSTGRIIEVDLNSGTIERTLEFEGSYLSAREIDGIIRIVVSSIENRFPFLYPSGEGAFESATEANKRLIADSTIDQWLPSYRLLDGAPTTDRDAGNVIDEGPLVACDRVHLPADFAGFGSVAVLTVNIDEGLAIDDSLSVFTDGQTVYASTDRLTVATPRWPEFNDDGTPVEDDSYRTAIHNFDITDPTRTSYTASGSVQGYLLSQYSLSEYDGYLRVATTEQGGRWWGWRPASPESESFVTVLAEEGTDLVQVGQVGGLGVGEQIQSVRFMGELGYVVTFEQIDPLYAIDLSDPADPTVLDELKIEGFSAYLHPVGDGKLLGVGPDGTADGTTFGVVASLFDVSNPNDISRAFKLPIGPDVNPNELGPGRWFDSSTNLQWDPKSFTYWNDTALIPIQWSGYAENQSPFFETYGSAVVLVRVDAENNTLETIGSIGHPVSQACEGRPVPLPSSSDVTVTRGEFGPVAGFENASDRQEQPLVEESLAEDPEALTIAPDGEFCFEQQPQIERTVIIGDRLFTVSQSGVGVNNFDTLDTVTWIAFS